VETFFGNGNEVQLCKIRNPWGKVEWNGDWGDDSDKWTDQLKEELELTQDDDGTFWMDFEDVKKYFGWV
jgi:calpain-15